MRLTEVTPTIRGERVAFVPYLARHVACYAAWMADPELRAATASELLSLEEEVENQASWMADETKATFLLVDLRAKGGEILSDDALCGDINLFLSTTDEGEKQGELNLMVALAQSRRRGIAREAVSLMMAWASDALGVKRFVAKIGVNNAASLSLFDSLGFSIASTSSVFEEHTLERVWNTV